MVGASPSTVLSWVDRGWLPAHRTPGGHRRIERQALVDFLRAHDMPELGTESEPMRLLLVVRPAPESQELRVAIGQRMPDLRIDQADGVYSGLAHLFESPPDVLVIDASMPGIDVTVLCRELRTLAAGSKLRVIVIRPLDMASLDDNMREAGAWAVLNAPVTAEDVCESLSVGHLDGSRTKAS